MLTVWEDDLRYMIIAVAARKVGYQVFSSLDKHLSQTT